MKRCCISDRKTVRNTLLPISFPARDGLAPPRSRARHPHCGRVIGEPQIKEGPGPQVSPVYCRCGGAGHVCSVASGLTARHAVEHACGILRTRTPMPVGGASLGRQVKKARSGLLPPRLRTPGYALLPRNALSSSHANSTPVSGTAKRLIFRRSSPARKVPGSQVTAVR